MIVRAAALLLVLVALTTAARAAFPPPEHPLFEGDAVHEIHLNFHQVAWWDSLVHNFEDFEEPRYLAADLDWGEVHLDSIGVRFKGFSSYWYYPGFKKPFKLDTDFFRSGQTLAGLDKLNLNNLWGDPSFVREPCFWDLVASTGLASLRRNYAAVYLNGEYWGLYDLSEQINDSFIAQRLGSTETGNLWKGDPEGTLKWLGPDAAAYIPFYELKTNETANDWSDLVDLIRTLHETPTADLPDSLSPRLELESALTMLAMNNLTVNLDSYSGSARNYYLYHRDLDDRFVLTSWDANLAWGSYSMDLSIAERIELPLFWIPDIRPLSIRLWERPEYVELYMGIMRRLLAGPAHPGRLLPRMERLRDLIRPWVHADEKMMFSSDEFEAAMEVNILYAPALEPMVSGRHAYLSDRLEPWNGEVRAGLLLNEIMPVNDGSVLDDHGEKADWIEIANVGPWPQSLAGLTLTDDLAYPARFALPDTVLQTDEYLLLWADGQTHQGEWHAPFGLADAGGSLWLLESGVILDRLDHRGLEPDLSWGRWPDGGSDWIVLSEASPGAANAHEDPAEPPALFINEILASNASVIQDEMGEYEDWVELYNAGVDTARLGGLFLSDDFDRPTRWAFPDTSLAPGAFLLVWCDGDPEDGPLHTDFRLSAGGEEIGIFASLVAGNAMIDGYVFGPQTTDISEGRYYDGGLPWILWDEPTPGRSNREALVVPPPPDLALRLLPNYPNPFNPNTRLSFSLPAAGHVRLEIFDARGSRVRLLCAEDLPAGQHSLDWDGRDKSGFSLPSGLYFSRLDQDGAKAEGRLLLLR